MDSIILKCVSFTLGWIDSFKYIILNLTADVLLNLWAMFEDELVSSI